MYHFPFVAVAFPGVPFPFPMPQKRVGRVPVSAVNAGAVVVEFNVTVSAVAQLDCALTNAMLNNNTRIIVFFFIMFY